MDMNQEHYSKERQLKRNGVFWSLDRDTFEQVVKKCSSFSAILSYFGRVKNGAALRALKERLDYDKINIEHFKAKQGADLKFRVPARPLSELLINHSPCKDNRGLKHRLLKEGILKNICALCGQRPEWFEKPLTLILDHINGHRDDYRIENLRIVCPNCNMQLPTTNGKNRRKIKNCIDCGSIISKVSTRCLSCAARQHAVKKITNRPSMEQLQLLVKSSPITKIAQVYGVTGNSIRKWCKLYGIHTKIGRGYWTKNNLTHRVAFVEQGKQGRIKRAAYTQISCAYCHSLFAIKVKRIKEKEKCNQSHFFCSLSHYQAYRTSLKNN